MTAHWWVFDRMTQRYVRRADGKAMGFEQKKRALLAVSMLSGGVSTSRYAVTPVGPVEKEGKPARSR